MRPNSSRFLFAGSVVTCLVCALMGVSSLRAELPPETYKRLRENAPELLHLRVVRVTVASTNDDVIRYKVEATVGTVERSDADFKKGDRLTSTSYRVTDKALRNGFVGPASPPELYAGWSGWVFLSKNREGNSLEPAAYGRSFHPDQKHQRADGTAPQPKPQSDLLTNTLGMELALIPAGEFQMGTSMPELSEIDPSLEPHDRVYLYSVMMVGTDEGPRHRVRITKAFYLGRTEVTIGQFRRFVAQTSYSTEAERDGKGGIGYNAETKQMDMNKYEPAYNWQRTGWEQSDNHPVVNVSWNDAIAFCEWLSKKEGKPYRLPTEAEWEYGCRANTETMYYHGNSTQSVIRIGNIADKSLQEELPKFAQGFICKGRDGFPFTAPVGRFEENGFRLFDMTGNVWEWCSDRYGALYYHQSPVSDPPGPSVGGARVIRGGGWLSEPATCRSVVRSLTMPSARSVDLGFRVALTAR